MMERILKALLGLGLWSLSLSLCVTGATAGLLLVGGMISIVTNIGDAEVVISMLGHTMSLGLVLGFMIKMAHDVHTARRHIVCRAMAWIA